MSIRSSVRVPVNLLLTSIAIIAWSAGLTPAMALEKLERGHFTIYHSNRNLANKLSWRAEYHYKRIVNHFGVKEFRPWKDGAKCPIYLYPSRDAYLKATGAPEWSGGLAQYQPFRFSCYEGSPDLLNGTLPHEMVHMLLYLFMDKKPVPRWLNEGMAQFEEEDQSMAYRRKKTIKHYVAEGAYLKLEDLMKLGALPAEHSDVVSIYYTEAASVVDHLITDNIRANYGRFLTYLKNGSGVEDALKKAYQWKYKNGISDLEKRWIDFVKGKY